MDGWLGRQGTRAAWLARDVGMAVRGGVRAMRAAGPPPQPSVALLVGDAFAVAGQPNRYHVRIVNPLEATVAVELACRVERPGHASAETRHTLALTPRAAVDRWVRTDWVAELTLLDVRPEIAMERYLLPPETQAMGVVHVTLTSAGAPLVALAIRQPLAA